MTIGPTVRGCDRCPDYDDGSPEPVRHLAYHVMPAAGSFVWKLGIDQLRSRWPLFTGKKVVAVVTGPGLDPPEAVRDYLPADAELVTAPNSPQLREVATWSLLWDRLLPEIGATDAILYAHAKAVTRPLDPGNMTHVWASLLYSVCLDHWPAVRGLLRRYPIVGAAKKIGRAFPGLASAWHYSGTFFWLRAGEFRRRLARHPMPMHRYGVEAWPGIAYRTEEAGRLVLEGAVSDLDLYDPRKWERYRQEIARWLQLNPPAWPWITASVR